MRPRGEPNPSVCPEPQPAAPGSQGRGFKAAARLEASSSRSKGQGHLLGPFPPWGGGRRCSPPTHHLQLRLGREDRPRAGTFGGPASRASYSSARQDGSGRRAASWGRGGRMFKLLPPPHGTLLLFPAPPLPTPHPSQHPHTTAFLPWDGEGIILILQNAQQLIKSRSLSAFEFFCM